jgi:phasin
MAQTSKSPFEFPAEMLAMTEQSIDQARTAFEKMMGMAQTTLGTVEERSKAAQAGARDVGAKVMEFAERNVADAFAYAQKLVHAKDPQTLVELHSEFVRTQIKTLTEQAKALGEAAGNPSRNKIAVKSMP